MRDTYPPAGHIHAILSILLLLVLAACGGLGGEPAIVATQAGPTALPEDIGHPLTPPDVAEGARLFAENCTDCHGADGSGDGPLVVSGQVPASPDFTDFETARDRRPSEYFEIISNGQIDRLMPPWRGALSEAERWAVTMAAYTLGYTQAQLDEGRALYEAHCAECHGERGRGDGPRAGELTRPVGDLSDPIELSALPDSALYTVVTEGQGEQMPAFQDELTDEQRWAVVSYVRSLSLAGTEAIGGIPGAEGTAEATVEPTVVSINGTVTNGTAGASVPAGLPVTLYAIEETATGFENETFAAQTNDDGGFEFLDVPVFPGRMYLVSAEYRERIFTSDLVSGEALIAEPEIDVTIYELTEDPTVVRIKHLEMRIDAVGDGLQILQQVVFENTSDRLYTNALQVSENAFASVVTGLPPGAVGLAFPGNPQRFIHAEEQQVVVDTIPVQPGLDHEVQMSYFVPYSDGAVIEQPVYYHFEGTVRVLTWPEALAVTSEQMAPVAAQPIGDRVYEAYEGRVQLEPGEVVRFDLSGRAPAAGVDTLSQPAQSNTTLLIIGIVVEIAIVAALGYVLWRRRRPRPQANRQLIIDGLIRQIAELDNQFEAGKVDEATYQSQRSQLKARLAELMTENRSPKPDD